MTSFYEAPTDDDRGHGDRLREAVELTAAGVSLLGEDITDLANLVRDGLPVRIGRGAGVILAYQDALDVLRGRRAEYRNETGTEMPTVTVAVPTVDDVLVILGKEEDPLGQTAAAAWLEEVRAESDTPTPPTAESSHLDMRRVWLAAVLSLGGNAEAKRDMGRVVRAAKKEAVAADARMDAAARRVLDLGPSYWFPEARRTDEAAKDQGWLAAADYLEAAFGLCYAVLGLQELLAFTTSDFETLRPVVTATDLATATGDGHLAEVQDFMAEAMSALNSLRTDAWTERTAADVLLGLARVRGIVLPSKDDR